MKKKKQRENGLFLLIVRIVGGLLFRRRAGRIHQFLPLLAGFYFLFTFLSYLSPPIEEHHHISHSSSSIHGVEGRMNVEKESDFRVPRGGGSLGRELWSTNRSQFFYGCSNASNKFLTAEVSTRPDRYLLIATSGGLNQQRTGIVDAVVAAYILNATLVVPKLDQKSYWKDDSNFSQIFDVDWFISHLEKDVKIIKELPTGGKGITPYSTRVPRKCNAKCYQTRVLPLLKKKHAVQLTKFDYRLSNRLSTNLQKLRCRVNYHGLKFTDPILEMGQKLVDRMRSKSKHFVALHLRFEPDMLAFSGCYYGGGEKETKELAKIRKRWATLHTKDPEKQRRQGRCPLTPEEVGLLLRALGYGDGVHIYVASGDVYGGEETMAPLKALFPNFHTKETLASKEELAPFSSYSSRMAALDYIVCDESDAFATNNNGNMAKILAGRRRYFGHKPTIRPNAKKLSKVFMSRDNMTWNEFSSLIRTHQTGFMGEPDEVKPGRGEFHENPAACICEASKTTAEGELIARRNTISGHDMGIDYTIRRDFNDEHISEDEQDIPDIEYLETENTIGGLPLKTETDTSAVVQPEQPEFEEIFSD